MEEDDPFHGFDLEDALAVDLLMGWDGPSNAICATCGAPLETDPDYAPAGDTRQATCGECHRAQLLGGPEP